jgi:hypothetical protein
MQQHEAEKKKQEIAEIHRKLGETEKKAIEKYDLQMEYICGEDRFVEDFNSHSTRINGEVLNFVTSQIQNYDAESCKPYIEKIIEVSIVYLCLGP